MENVSKFRITSSKTAHCQKMRTKCCIRAKVAHDLICVLYCQKKKAGNTDADNRNETKYWIQLTMSNTIIGGMLLPVCKGRFYKLTWHCSNLTSYKGLPSFATASSVWLLHTAVIHSSVTSAQMYTSAAALHSLTPDAPLRKEHSFLTFSTKTTTRGAFSQL